ncbi:MAG: glycerophosphodiester phosphodiesterase [Deinococcales bacterium]
MKRFLMFLAALIIILTVLYISFAYQARPLAKHPYLSDSPLVIAHQGGERLYPSNTLYAFSQAVDMGVDMLEFDIHASGDGELVIIHDDSVDRTTDGKGLVKELSFADLKSLDAGYYWTNDHGQSYPYRNKDITIPSVREVFEAFPQMPMVIEIKQQEPDITGVFCEMLKRYQMTDKVIIGSFYDEVMANFRERCPEVITSMSEGEVRMMVILNTLFVGDAFKPTAQVAQVPEASGNLSIINPRFISVAKQKNIAVQAWTINEEADMQRMLGLGLDGIITDRPDLLLQLLGR